MYSIVRYFYRQNTRMSRARTVGVQLPQLSTTLHTVLREDDKASGDLFTILVDAQWQRWIKLSSAQVVLQKKESVLSAARLACVVLDLLSMRLQQRPIDEVGGW
jgi:hypothetical protein